MRLIDVKTRELVEFMATPPPYAILSHTWGSRDDEVSYRDMTSGGDSFKAKKGWTKIEYCINQAVAEKLDYCWVDTCCIDKTSSAELSEAINSMFAWWFQRGWTLQELIAPRTREFFDASWNFIGVLRGFEKRTQYRWRRMQRYGAKPDAEDEPQSRFFNKIQHLSGIPDIVLLTGECDSQSIVEGMSWAGKRTTTRVEDEAYCLLGIFDINMPLLYGEGRKAFQRLQEEIIKQTNDLTILAWTDPAADRSTFHGLLASSPKLFSGESRGAERKCVDDQHKTSPLVVSRVGVRAKLELMPTEEDEEEYVAFLDAHVAFAETSASRLEPVCLIVRRVKKDSNLFARVDAGRLTGFMTWEESEIWRELRNESVKSADSPTVQEVFVPHTFDLREVLPSKSRPCSLVFTADRNVFLSPYLVHDIEHSGRMDEREVAISLDNIGKMKVALMLSNEQGDFVIWAITGHPDHPRSRFSVVENPTDFDPEELILMEGELSLGGGGKVYTVLYPTFQQHLINGRLVIEGALVDKRV